MQHIHPDNMLKTERYLDPIEIEENLKGIQYIAMATPSPKEGDDTIHFTLFLNTTEALPDGIAPQVMAKFAADNAVQNARLKDYSLIDVAFSLTSKETPMPVAAYDDVQAQTRVMYVIEFDGVSDSFKESKEGLTGWSYVKN